MKLVMPIPDDLACRLHAGGEDIARRALEAFGVEEYRAHRLTDAEMCELLGFETRTALDGFLKQRGVFLDYTADDLDRDRREFARLGL